MKVTLTDDEVRQILREALYKKMDFNCSKPTEENTWFDVTDANGEVQDLEEVTFTCDLGKD